MDGKQTCQRFVILFVTIDFVVKQEEEKQDQGTGDGNGNKLQKLFESRSSQHMHIVSPECVEQQPEKGHEQQSEHELFIPKKISQA